VPTRYALHVRANRRHACAEQCTVVLSSATRSTTPSYINASGNWRQIINADHASESHINRLPSINPTAGVLLIRVIIMHVRGERASVTPQRYERGRSVGRHDVQYGLPKIIARVCVER